ncbi:S-layer homology domain-containing protein [Butyricicoccus pullicaecorum]|uniref:SLH domain-containing protein n=1 Tax=Butyricicoccus pullicaecorum 1.2 TaxID=1203606 RepID=R8VXA7_9FIRM|nr:S-layer homology domain-containing protein [Butyricicoccus pullicaecorum]EOQ35547.1 hypothetical protein HMPREF1526_03014 [Butyricicoccus pullicaecorum 1.2]SKA67707.1 S-layer homology domain-containing protein [Butyricicoccus pullicaecorum DSM 23266]
MKTQTTRAGRFILSLLLSLMMVLGIFPAAALAADDLISTQLVIELTVEQDGAKTPPAETFAFELEDSAQEVHDPEFYGITLKDSLSIPTKGTGTFQKMIPVQIDRTMISSNNGWNTISGTPVSYDKTFYLTVKDDGKPGWTYASNAWAVTFNYTPATEQLNIQLHSRGNDGRQDYASYTNIYSYSESRYELPFTKTVKQGGSAAPGRQAFALEIFNVGVSSLTDYDDLYTATVTTNGAGDYKGTLTISGPTDMVEALVCEGFYVREKNTGAADWTYSDAVWHVVPDYDFFGGRKLVIYPAERSHTENNHEFYTDGRTPVSRMTFENTYTSTSGAVITAKKTDALGTPLADAAFVLKNSRGDTMYKAVSNTRGEIRFDNVASGSYTLLEESAPSGYVKSDQSYELTVNGSHVTTGGKTYTPITFVNRKAVTLNRDDHFTFLVGYSDGTFGPELNMTRAEVTTMFSRLITEQIEADKTYANTFSDVPPSHWAANHIGFMQQFGIITGYSDGSFRPDAPVTRAEFSAIATRFEKLTEGTKSFTDVPPTHWAAKYINFAATRGWVNGYSDGTFRLENPIVRAEVAAVTCRLLERTADQSYIRSHLAQLRTFRDMTESHWAYWYVMEAANGHDYTKTANGETWNRIHP